MTQTNTINTIKETEKKAEEMVQTAKEKVVAEYQKAKQDEENKLIGLKKELVPQFKDILDQADKDIARKVEDIEERAKVNIEKVTNISEDKQKEAVELIVNAITE